MSETSAGVALGGLRGVSGELSAGDRPARTLRLRNARVARAFDLAGKRVLDVGCAEGLHALYMAESATEVVGIDHRASVIAQAQANQRLLGIENVRFRCADVRDAAALSDDGRFDLVVAWGFLHRVSDVFTLLQRLGAVGDALSLEWRTPVYPFMSRISLAYHSPLGDALDPMNLEAAAVEEPADDASKIEGQTGFWEPSPGAVRTLCRRQGYEHWRLMGYDENLKPQVRMIARKWRQHVGKLLRGKAKQQLPLARVHALFERERGSIVMRDPFDAAVTLPRWDERLCEKAGQRG